VFTSVVRQATGGDVMIWKKKFTENFFEKIGVFCSKYCLYDIILLFLRKKSPKIGKKSLKIAFMASTMHYRVDSPLSTLWMLCMSAGFSCRARDSPHPPAGCVCVTSSYLCPNLFPTETHPFFSSVVTTGKFDRQKEPTRSQYKQRTELGLEAEACLCINKLLEFNPNRARTVSPKAAELPSCG
jgi:hypothetical protein